MKYYVIFAEKDKIVAINETDIGYYIPSPNTVFLMCIKARRMGPRILKRIIERLRLKRKR